MGKRRRSKELTDLVSIWLVLQEMDDHGLLPPLLRQVAAVGSEGANLSLFFA
jgi:hypothetical protein